jgi:hypothetical protein
MHIRQTVKIPSFDFLPRAVIDILHGESCVVQCKSRRKERKNPYLHGGIIEDRQFRPTRGPIAVRELAAHSCISHGYCDSASEDEARVLDYLRAHERQCSVDDG